MILPLASPACHEVLTVSGTPQLQPKGGVASNTPPSISQKSTGGEDTVYIGYYVEWGAVFANLFESLELHKQQAQTEGSAVEFSFSGLSFELSPGGYSSGGSKGIHVPYSLRANGCRIGLSNLEKPNGATPNVYVMMGSSVLMYHGGVAPVHDMVLAMLDQLGGQVVDHKLSRVDICADMGGVPVHEFSRLFLANGLVSKARNRAHYWRGLQPTGFTLGKGALQLRVYDKRLETQKDPSKWELMQLVRLEEGETECTRVEVQIRREVLKTMGIDTVEDWLQSRAAVAEYLLTHWARLCEPISDRTHTSRAQMADCWRDVLRAFQSWTGTARETITRCMERCATRDLEGLERQALGCLLRVVAERSDGCVFDKECLYDEVTRYLAYAIDRAEKEGVLEDKQEAKCLDYLARCPFPDRLGTC